MDLQLKDKVFIVSGGAKGIGEAITRGLASEGAIPVIAGRSKEAGEELADQITSSGGRCLNIVRELSEDGSCEEVIRAAVKELGRIDGVVNNAGVNDGASLESGGPEKFRQSINLNLFHYFELVHFSLPYLKETKGSVVNISSKTALTGQGGTSGYAASKGAQLALTREWAVELGKYGIRVNAIVPAEVSTPQYDKWINSFDNPQEKLDKIVSKIPLEKRMTTSEEIAAMTIFLLSQRSSHTTGQWIFVDGGYVHLDRALT